MKINNYFNYLFITIVFFVFCSFIIKHQDQFYKKPTFGLLTDFGYDFAVGSVKGVIASKLPNAHIIDLDHSIDKFNVISAGFVLASSYRYFPEGTIFVCVIDPGVGTAREPICIKTEHYSFIGPNNGIFDFILEQEKERIIYTIDQSYIKSEANTFHGRDLFAPAAVDLHKNNLDNFHLFNEKKLVHIKTADKIIATYIDSFGNVKTNKKIDRKINCGSVLFVKINETAYKIPFVKTFEDVAVGQLLCYAGSNNTIEIAVNRGSAAQYLRIVVGDQIELSGCQ